MSPERASALAANIRRYRLTLGLSQAKLGQAVAVDKTTVAHWEAGDYSPNLFVVQRLAELFECSMEDLLSVAPCAP